MNIFNSLRQILFNPVKYIHQLIAIHVLVFGLLKGISAVLLLFGFPFQFMELARPYLALPASLSLLFDQPWSLLTHLFLHLDFMHLVFNMLGLYWFGGFIEDYLGATKLYVVYVLGGLFGAVVYLLGYQIFPYFQAQQLGDFLTGSSAGVMAMAFGAAALLPNYRFNLLVITWGVRLGHIALVYLFLDLLNITEDNAGRYIAHIGGALGGFFLIKQLAKGSYCTRFFDVFWKRMSTILDKKPKLRLIRTRSKVKFSAGSSKSASKKTFTAPTKPKHTSAQMDVILAKIASSGYEKLTAEEKRLFFETNSSK